MNVNIVRQPDGSSQDLLRTNYFCQIDTSETDLEVVMEMEANGRKRNAVCKRYVLVIDVSGSMDSVADGQTASLMQRMKTFARLFINKAAANAWLGIVTFSDDARVVLRLTQMNKQGKEKATKAVETLRTEGLTNISAGLFLALELIKDRSHSRDSIIIFTDGAANCGITEAEPLITEYREKSQKGGESCVPLSAITVEGYLPGLLYEISYHLGSDAFYWVNVRTDFEADMMIPQIIREATFITDITVVATALRGVEIKLDTGNQVTTTTFIHSLPNHIKKNLLFRLQLPEDYKALDGNIILSLDISFIDGKLSRRSFTDSVQLCIKSMQEAAIEYGVSEYEPEELQKYRESVVAYVSSKNEVDASWVSIRESISKVFEERCKKEVAKCFNGIRINYIENADKASAAEELLTSRRFIERMIDNSTRCLDENDLYRQKLSDRANVYLKHLQHAQVTIENADAGDFDTKLWGAFAAMGSSFEKEMPTASGVFSTDLQQPFMHPIIENKLGNVRRTLKGKRQRKIPLFKGHNVIISEKLKGKKVGEDQLQLASFISNLGARPVSSATTFRSYGPQNGIVFMVCSQSDFERQSQLFMDAIKNKVPVVSEKYLHDCVAAEKALKRRKYLMKC
ncbi:uncharacterized protein LOC100178306 [Ciona intestinalis]